MNNTLHAWIIVAALCVLTGAAGCGPAARQVAKRLAPKAGRVGKQATKALRKPAPEFAPRFAPKIAPKPTPKPAMKSGRRISGADFIDPSLINTESAREAKEEGSFNWFVIGGVAIVAGIIALACFSDQTKTGKNKYDREKFEAKCPRCDTWSLGMKKLNECPKCDQ